MTALPYAEENLLFINSDKSLHETRVLDNTYLHFKVQLPISDSTEITAGGPKIH